MTVERYDVVIVGGRVAGSTLAALLGRAGAKVLLLDKARFPSDTLSTHVIFGDSFTVWEEAGAWPAIEAIGAVRMEAIDWRRKRPNSDICVRISSTGGHDYSLCLRRILLDEILFLNAAGAPGVTALEATEATELLRADGRVCGVRYAEQGGRGAVHSAHCSVVVGADGHNSFVARAVGAPFVYQSPPCNFPFYSYFRNVKPINPPAFQLWESDKAQGTVMLVPCDDGIWMGVVYTPQEQYDAFRKSHTERFEERIRSDARVGPRLADAVRIAPVRGRGDLANFLRVPVGRGWALVGDSGQHKDPIFGQGIGDAVRSAKLLAAKIMEGLAGDVDRRLAQYHVYRDQDLLPKFDFMINRRAAGIAADDFEWFSRDVGHDPALASCYMGIFTGGSKVHDVFNTEVVETWKERQPARKLEKAVADVPA